MAITIQEAKSKAADTDKFKHYTNMYDFYLQSLSNESINILEIGVKDGKSLRLWSEIFPNATIYGLDIDPRCKQYETDRIKVFIGDQGKRETFEAFGDVKFDVIIDDGSHVSEHMEKSFQYLWADKLNLGGFYFIEDVSMIFHDRFLGQQQDVGKFEAFLNVCIRKLHLDNFSNRIIGRRLKEKPKHRANHNHDIAKKAERLIGVSTRDFDNDILYVHIYPNLIVYRKKFNLDLTVHDQFKI